MKNSKFKIQNLLILFCIFHFAFSISCSIPNLESPECSEASNAVREFYSFHLGNDMKPSAENLKLREKFLSKELFKTLSATSEKAKDYFTITEDYPKAFRIGRCEVVSPQKTIFEVLLFWKDTTRSEQRPIKVEAIKENEKWLIDKVENK
ncbi:MAG: DUF3828 domain-containing protein [Pyrinomonadaceae bacterium]